MSQSTSNLAFDKWVTGVSPDDRAREVAACTLRLRLDAVLHYLELATDKANNDTENIHELRVWTRRAAAALSLYHELLPSRRARWICKQMRRLRRAASAARDSDVLVERLKQRAGDPAIAQWLKKIRAQRKKAQKPIVALRDRLIRTGRLASRTNEMLERLQAGSQETSNLPDPAFATWARRHMRPFVRSFLQAFPLHHVSGRALHQFRIRAKELRYEMELVAPAFQPAFRGTLYPLIEAFQDELGSIEDMTLACAKLRKRIRRSNDSGEAKRLRKLLKADHVRLQRARWTCLCRCTRALRKQLRNGFKNAMADHPPTFD